MKSLRISLNEWATTITAMRFNQTNPQRHFNLLPLTFYLLPVALRATNPVYQID